MRPPRSVRGAGIEHGVPVHQAIDQPLGGLAGLLFGKMLAHDRPVILPVCWFDLEDAGVLELGNSPISRGLDKVGIPGKDAANRVPLVQIG